MLTLNTAGKSIADALKLIRSSLAEDEEELKILIDGLAQADGIMKFLREQGFSDVMPEDDDGELFIIATKNKKPPEHAPEPAPAPVLKPEPKAQIPAKPQTYGVLISAEAKKYRPSFLNRFTASLLKADIKPDVIALMNSAVHLAVYSSSSCDTLKELEAKGVNVLVSESCSDNLGLTEAIGAGVMCSMSEILDKIFSCEKVVSI